MGSRQSEYAFEFEKQRSPSVCRVHACARCHVALESAEPCSFLRTTIAACGACRGQEQVSRNLPVSRAWGAGLARARRS